jgi:environmental stress-induced protein Ves
MSFPIIRAADCPPQPWKNGMGTTREIARFPADAGADDFLWRVSVAEVNSAAPFSEFPGIDRHIALLDGDGFTMTLDGVREHALVQPFVPFAFPGEARIEVTMAGAGATRDFNLMVRRELVRGDVQALTSLGSHTPDPACVLVYVAQGTMKTLDGTLEAGDAWLPDRSPFELGEGSVALVVQVLPR